MPTTNIDARAALRFAERCVLATGASLRAGFGAAPYTNKSGSAADVVTALDVETEERLSTALGAFDGGIGVHGEELGASLGDGDSGATYWLIDPIDGTGHYVRGTPFCTTMVALIHEGRAVASVINDFVRSRLYSASLGGGATVNGEPIHVSDRSLAEAYVTAEMATVTDEEARTRARLREQVVIMATVCSGWDFAMIAEGRLEGRVVLNGYGKDHDYAPGTLLVTEAGGIVTNMGSRGYDVRDHDFVAANPRVHAALTTGEGCLFPVV